MGKEPKGQDESDPLGDEVISAIGKRIVALRKERGLTQDELGKLAGVTQGRIAELEQRTSNVTVRTLVRLAHIFDVELIQLLSDVHIARDQRLADVLDRWTTTLDARIASDKALMEELRPFIEIADAVLIRKQHNDKTPPGDECPRQGSPAPRKPVRKNSDP